MSNLNGDVAAIVEKARQEGYELKIRDDVDRLEIRGVRTPFYEEIVENGNAIKAYLKGEPSEEIRAFSRERDRARIELRPIPASQLGNGEKVDWIWHGYLARGHFTLLIGLWKGGKSTLVSHLLKAMESGGTLAGEVYPGKVLVITEEGSGLWAQRRNDIGLGDHAYFHIRPFKGRPSRSDWMEYIRQIAKVVEDDKYDLVIIDTWQAMNPCHDENDAAGMMDALTPLYEIAEAGAGVLLVHHPRKGDAGEGQASRGSGALPGFVDTILELRRFNAQDASDRRRKLSGRSRFDETPAEVVIELTDDDGYKLVGTTGDANRNDRLHVIQDLLTDSVWISSEQIHDQWPEGTVSRPCKRIIKGDLNHGYSVGKWQREGKGVKGDAYRYKFDSCTVQPLSAGIESNSDCDHQDPGSWVHRDGKAYCPGCDKHMGRTPPA